MSEQPDAGVSRIISPDGGATDLPIGPEDPRAHSILDVTRGQTIAVDRGDGDLDIVRVTDAQKSEDGHSVTIWTEPVP